MKNLTDHRDKRPAPRVPRSGGHDPFRFRKRVTEQVQKARAQKEWRRHEPEEYRAASLRKLILGRLPGRLAKFGSADFDLSETCEYSGDDGVAVAGSELAGIAAHIVRCAKHPVDYLFSLRNVPAKVIAPMKAYLRIKLAMGRLRAEIENASARPQHNSCSDEVPAQGRDDSVMLDIKTTVIPDQRRQPCRAGTSQGQDDEEDKEHLNATLSSTPQRSCEVLSVCSAKRRDDRNILRADSVIKPIEDFPPLRSGGGGPGLLEQKQRVGGGGILRSDSESQLQNEIAPIERFAPTSPACGGRKPPPSFTWQTSPAKTHDFKELTKSCGYDPRETSVYWIEKRANALRRKWKKHGQKLRGESPALAVKERREPRPETDKNTAPKVKHFTPQDIDYNSVWPPVKMPDGPPKVAEAANEAMAETVVESRLEKESIENESATPQQDSCSSEVSSVCLAKRGDDRGTKSDKINNLSSQNFAEQTSKTSRGQYDFEGAELLNTSLSSTPRRSREIPEMSLRTFRDDRISCNPIMSVTSLFAKQVSKTLPDPKKDQGLTHSAPSPLPPFSLPGGAAVIKPGHEHIKRQDNCRGEGPPRQDGA